MIKFIAGFASGWALARAPPTSEDIGRWTKTMDRVLGFVFDPKK